MLCLRPNINIFNEIIHNGPVHMYRRILHLKKSTTSVSSSKTNFINYVVIVFFVVVVPAPNIISVDYDNDDVLEVREGTMGTVDLVTEKKSGGCSRGGRVPRIY